VHLAVPNGASMVYIEKLESPSAVRMASRIGTSVSLHATAVGKAYMAALDDKALKALMKGLPMPRYTGNTMVEPAALLAQIEQTRARGWSVDNEENEAGIFCFGAVIRGATGAPVAAISVSTLVFRQKEHPEQAYVAPTLLEACRVISERIAQTPSLSEKEKAIGKQARKPVACTAPAFSSNAQAFSSAAPLWRCVASRLRRCTSNISPASVWSAARPTSALARAP
jgi:hypothetical protein